MNTFGSLKLANYWLHGHAVGPVVAVVKVRREGFSNVKLTAFWPKAEVL